MNSQALPAPGEPASLLWALIARSFGLAAGVALALLMVAALLSMP
jgi:hypothetical protein